uniref:WSC domain-containing protein ARB_07867-like n=1 Tax=Crassostrea virginica TaxID=6565 RepID=A0A8B8CI64_CRAVI|nr:WSC domain-containing protein ARB_07867-like [Crassostrea virginica]
MHIGCRCKRRTMKGIFFYCIVLFFTGVVSDDYKRVGCVKDLISGRILREKAGKLKPNSPWNCQKFCAGYRYFGVEYSNECFCGNALIPPVIPSSKCTMACSGSPLLKCGGNSAIDVYRRHEKRNIACPHRFWRTS